MGYRKIDMETLKNISEYVNYIMNNNIVDSSKIQSILNYLSNFPYDYRAMFYYHKLVEFNNKKKTK